jgi:hypothetical protein
MFRFTSSERIFIVVALSAFVVFSAVKTWWQRAHLPRLEAPRASEISGARQSKTGPVPDHD